ncbi:ubiquitin-activating enzyme, putative [Trypanosoma cruzi marinkellei]|uniref:Ubiquitin-activating enzyme, putative n=1 Tax=Trypanosoma cruzi marinkellei TaxID=85056 RepID=K2NJ23_TRYCR|nr:ubiquitin-activating enzyme, putative [Trypanosoma cruzi marinkellei]
MLNAAIYERTQILIGDEGVRKLQGVNVFLVGVGGVGGNCAEALVRSGVGRITLCDYDVVSASNKNRQIVALNSTIGKSKVEVLAQRLLDINTHCRVTALDTLLLPEDVDDILTRQRYDYVVDCIDSVECKVALLAASVRHGIQTFSSCGAGGRLDPSFVSIGDLFETENDALARRCRNELRKHGIGPGKILVVYSKEKARQPLEPQRQESGGRDRSINGTISYMPPLFGLLLSAAVVQHALDPVGAQAEAKRRLKSAKKKAAQAKKRQRLEP